MLYSWRAANGSNSTSYFSMMRPVYSEIWKRCMNVRTCRCTPSVTCMKCIAGCPITTHQISAQRVQPLPRYGKEVRHIHKCRC